jgi:choline dehydrogenase-like flavoprotein
LRATLLESGQRRSRGVVVRAAGRIVFRYVSPRAMEEGTHVATHDPATQWYYSLAPGGLTNFWTGAVPRFAPADFTDGARLDERFHWPVTYDELVPYYEIAEAALRITGGRQATPVLPANAIAHEVRLAGPWATAAQKLDKEGTSLVPLPMAIGSRWMVAFRGAEFNSYTTLVRPLRARHQLRIVTGAHVRQLVWSPPDSRVVAVEYLDRSSGRAEHLAVDAVILAAGALNSTRILMVSRSADFPRGLGNNSGIVGRYLHDHPREWFTISAEKPLPIPDHPAYLARERYESSEPLLAASCTIGVASRIDRLRSFAGRSSQDFGVTVFGTMIPDEMHTVSLSQDRRDDLGQPILELAIAYDDRTRQNVVRARERLADAFSCISNPIRVPSDVRLHPPGASVHYAGTVRMHENPEFGVLDAWNRVHDAPNVVVCDMSCFTTSPEKNPTLTAMALAARAADRLADDLIA